NGAGTSGQRRVGDAGSAVDRNCVSAHIVDRDRDRIGTCLGVGVAATDNERTGPVRCDRTGGGVTVAPGDAGRTIARRSVGVGVSERAHPPINRGTLCGMNNRAGVLRRYLPVQDVEIRVQSSRGSAETEKSGISDLGKVDGCAEQRSSRLSGTWSDKNLQV